MNRAFRIVWSHAQNAWVVVCELANRCSKRGSGSGRRSLAAVRACMPLIVLTSLLAGLPATAADLYWDTNGTSGGLGSAFGTWNTTNTFWTTNSLGTNGHQSWNNGSLDNAIFNNGFGSTVTLAEALSVHNLTFQASGYTITGNTLTLGGTTPTITITGAFSSAISSTLAGTNGMTLSGGTLTLSAANTLTGGITINSGKLIAANNANNILNGANNVVTINNGGVLEIQNSNAFGGNTEASRLVMNDGAKLLLNEANLIHNITANGGTITIQDEVCCSTSTWTGTLTLNANTTLFVNNTGGSQSWGTTFAGNLTDTGANRLSLTFDAINSQFSFLTLSGNNSFTGGITLGRGELRLASANSAGGPGNIVTVNNLGTLTVQNANAFGGDTSAANLRLNSGGTLNVAGGVTLQHDVRLDQTSATISGTGGTWNGTAVLNAGNAVLTFGGTVTATGNLFDNGAVLSVTTNGPNVGFSGPLNFSGNLTVDGFDTWLNPAGSFTYTGDTIITDDARLWLNSATPISPNTNIRFEGTTAAGATVIGLTTNYPTFARPIGAAATELRWAGNGGFYARSNQSDATVNLFGDLRTLTWGAGGTPDFVPDGSMLILGTDTTGSGARAVDFRNGIDLNGQLRSVRADNGSVSDHAIISGLLSGTGGLRTIGTGALELNNTNTYTGLTVVGDGVTAGWGNLILGSAGALPSASNLQFDGVVSGEMLGSGGVVLLTAASGDFTRSLGTGADQMHWTRSGGFAAMGANRTVNIGGAGATLAWNSTDFVPTGQALRFGSLFSSARVDFVNGIDLGAVDRVISVVDDSSSSASAEARLTGVIEGAGGLNVRGTGDIELSAANTFTGALTIGAASTVSSSGPNHDDGMRVYANTLADAGTASSLGAGSSVVLSSTTGALIYTGTTDASTNRTLTLRDNTIFGGDAQLGLLNQSTSGSLTWTGNITTGASSNRDILVLGGSYNTSLDGNGSAVNPNVVSGVISNAGAVLRVSGTSSTGFSCSSGNVWRLTGANTFTGSFATDGCAFEVTSLKNAGLASSIGASTNVATNLDLLSNGTLRYVGSGDSTDRLLRAGSNSRIESSGTGALAFTNTSPIAFAFNSGWQHWLGGTSADANRFELMLVNGASPTVHTSGNFTLGKDGRGLWALPTDNNAHANSYTGNTRIAGGALRLNHAGAITGGLGVTSSHGAIGSTQRSSLIQFEGSPTSGNPTVLGLTAASGGFFRGTTAVTTAFLNDNGTSSNLDDDRYTHGVRWNGSGGFAAWDGTQDVNLFNDQRQVTWNTSGFVPTGQNLVFGYGTATGTVDFRNPIELGGAQRTFEVYRGLAAMDAILSNVVSGTGGMIKTANGILVLTADNTFAGNSAVQGGTLQLGDGGAGGSGSLGTSPTVSVSAGATLAVNHSDAHTLNHSINGDGTLQQMGAGTTTMTSNSDIDHVVIDAGRLITPTSLFAEDITFAGGGATLEVAGTLRRSGGMPTLVTGSVGDDIFLVTAAGTATVTAALGDGNDTLDVAGTLNIGGGTFDLGDGDDAFVIHGGTNVIGTVVGGAGNDTRVYDLTGTANIGALQQFEGLTKRNTGTLNLNGPAITDLFDVAVEGGTLNIAGGGVTGVQTAAVAAGATLNVDANLAFTSGADTFTVGGTVSGSGSIDLLDGDDNLIIQNGAQLDALANAIDGGAGTDTLTADIVGTAALGGAATFEQLAKTNAGTLNINGPAISGFASVAVQGGTLNVGAAGSIASVQTTTVDVGATLNVDGAFNGGASDDTMTVSGTVDGGGTFDLLAGDDVVTLNDGANLSSFTGTLDGGAQTASDRIVLNNAAALTIDAGGLTGFEQLTKQNTGIATLSGAFAFTTGATVNGGTLAVEDQLDTPTIALGDDTTLEVSGTVQNAGATPATITGTAAANTVRVTAGGLLLGSGALGDGNDTLDIAGTLDIGGGTFSLGDGDDTFTVHDGTTVADGTVDGGAGFDTRGYDIDSTANLSALASFEGLTKSGTGVLRLNGPGSSGLAEIEVLAGTLHVGVAGGVDSAQRTTVAGGATLQVDGAYSGTAGDDTMAVSGTVLGTGSVTLGAGEDVLTLTEGAVLGMQISGGAQTAGDTIALDIATTFTFDGVNTLGFETLAKQNVGTATVTSTQNYAATRVEGGTLDVDGTLEIVTAHLADDTTLNVDGTMRVSGAMPMAVTGSAGANTISIAATGTLAAAGDLGDGVDTLDVAGTLDIGGGTFNLGAGDDAFIVHDGTNVTGIVVGGAGLDTRVYDLAGTANVGALQEFEGLTKRNTGTLNINGPAITADLLNVTVEGGTLNISAASQVVGVQTTEVTAGAILNVDGDYLFTAGADTFAVAGTVSGLGTIDLDDGDDVLTLFDGADLSALLTSLEGGTGTDTLTADISTTARLGGAAGFETLIKEGAGSLTIAGSAGSQFDTVQVREGLLEVAAGAVVDPQTTAVDAGATLQVDGAYEGTIGADTFTLSGRLAGAGTVDLLDGDDALIIHTGAAIATFTGSFDAAAGTNRVVLAGSGTDSFDLSLMGTTLRNFAGFRKEGASTWRLTSTAEGNWTVAEGTLIGDSASFRGDIDNAATVVFDQAADGTLAGVLSGSGIFIKQNAGTLVLTGTSTFTGMTQVSGGVLQADGVLPGAMLVSDGAQLSGIGTVGAVSTLAGALVAPGSAANQFGTLTIAGNYTGGGTVSINTELGNEDSATSRLVIQGDTSGATSPVIVNRVGGEGVRTVGDGIGIIAVNGASPADSFRLAQPVQAGAYQYLLYQGGASDDNDWYLRSQFTGSGSEPGSDPGAGPEPAFRPGVAGYVLGHQASLEYGFTALGNLRSRVGAQGRVLDAQSGRSSDAWMNVYAHELDVAGARFEARDLRMSMLQFGTDIYRSETTEGGAHLGAMISLGEGSATFFDPARASAGLQTRAGNVEMDAKGAGLYWTLYGARGGYLDLVGQLLNYRNRYQDQFLAASSQRGWGGSFSAELGAAYALGGSGWKIEPQLQLSYQRLDLDEFTDNVSRVGAVQEHGLRARAGVQLFRAPSEWLGMSRASPYIGLGVQHDLRDADSIAIGGTALDDDIPETSADVSIGFAGSVGAGFELHVDARYQQATEGEKDGVRANFGFRKQF